VTAARALAFWPIMGVAVLTFLGATGIVGGALIVAMVRKAGGEIDGKVVMGMGLVTAFGAWILAILAGQTIATPFGLLAFVLLVHAGLSVGVRWSGISIRGGIYTDAALVVLLALTVTVLAPFALALVGATKGGTLFATLAATTLVSGVGLGMAASPRRFVFREEDGKWGLLPLGLVVAAGMLYAYRAALAGMPLGAESTTVGHAVWALGLLGLAALFLSVTAHRLLLSFRVARAPELHLPADEAQAARVVRADGSAMKVHVDVEGDAKIVTLLAYDVGDSDTTAYRSAARRVTADVVYRGSRKEAQWLLWSSALAWLSWALLTAAVASFGF
jgi:hypothetical protein